MLALNFYQGAVDQYCLFEGRSTIFIFCLVYLYIMYHALHVLRVGQIEMSAKDGSNEAWCGDIECRHSTIIASEFIGHGSSRKYKSSWFSSTS